MASSLPPPEETAWHVIACPSNLTLTKVDKERGTHGSIYVLWSFDAKSPAWVGQSIPALVTRINESAVTNQANRLHASSLYRCLRGEARKQYHKSWKVEKYTRDALTEMNKFLAEFPSVIYVSKAPELWKCNQQHDDVAVKTAEEEDHPDDDGQGRAAEKEQDATTRAATSPRDHDDYHHEEPPLCANLPPSPTELA